MCNTKGVCYTFPPLLDMELWMQLLPYFVCLTIIFYESYCWMALGETIDTMFVWLAHMHGSFVLKFVNTDEVPNMKHEVWAWGVYKTPIDLRRKICHDNNCFGNETKFKGKLIKKTMKWISLQWSSASFYQMWHLSHLRISSSTRNSCMGQGFLHFVMHVI